MNDDEDHLAEVIPLPRAFSYARNEMEAKLDELPVRTARAARPCPHTGSTVDEAARTLTCRACGATLDPIEVLAKLARSRETLVHHGVMLRRQVDSLRQTVAALERQERNAKARIRSARKRRTDEAAAVEGARAYFDAKQQGRVFDDLSAELRADWLRCLRPAFEAYVAALDVEPEAKTA